MEASKGTCVSCGNVSSASSYFASAFCAEVRISAQLAMHPLLLHATRAPHAHATRTHGGEKSPTHHGLIQAIVDVGKLQICHGHGLGWGARDEGEITAGLRARKSIGRMLLANAPNHTHSPGTLLGLCARAHPLPGSTDLLFQRRKKLLFGFSQQAKLKVPLGIHEYGSSEAHPRESGSRHASALDIEPCPAALSSTSL